MEKFRLIVAGGRDFKDYPLLRGEIDLLIDTVYLHQLVSIVSGMAPGADALGVRFAKEHNVVLHEYPANWDKYGKAAGFKRNEQMGRASDGLLAFWDTKSKGTAHMIDFMRSLNKPVHVINY